MMIAQSGTTLRPRLLLGYADSAHAARCARHFRRQGWEVHRASCGPEIRRLAQILQPDAVILAIDLPVESGWLTTAKLLLDRPEQRILLVGTDRTEAHEQFASFVGAAGFFTRAEGVSVLAEQAGGLLV